ncbi:asparagine/aspartate rich protein, partial [Reticulomyxa filosa]
MCNARMRNDVVFGLPLTQTKIEHFDKNDKINKRTAVLPIDKFVELLKHDKKESKAIDIDEQQLLNSLFLSHNKSTAAKAKGMTIHNDKDNTDHVIAASHKTIPLWTNDNTVVIMNHRHQRKEKGILSNAKVTKAGQEEHDDSNDDNDNENDDDDDDDDDDNSNEDDDNSNENDDNDNESDSNDNDNDNDEDASDNDDNENDQIEIETNDIRNNNNNNNGFPKSTGKLMSTERKIATLVSGTTNSLEVSNSSLSSAKPPSPTKFGRPNEDAVPTTISSKIKPLKRVSSLQQNVDPISRLIDAHIQHIRSVLCKLDVYGNGTLDVTDFTK